MQPSAGRARRTLWKTYDWKAKRDGLWAVELNPEPRVEKAVDEPPLKTGESVTTNSPIFRERQGVVWRCTKRKEENLL